MTAADVASVRPRIEECHQCAEALDAAIAGITRRFETAIVEGRGLQETISQMAQEVVDLRHELRGLRGAVGGLLSEMDRLQPVPGAPLKNGHA